MKKHKQAKAWGPLKGALANEMVYRCFRRYLRQTYSVIHAAREAGSFRNSKKANELQLRCSRNIAAQRFGSFVAVLHAFYKHAEDIPGPWKAHLSVVYREGREDHVFASEAEAAAVRDALNRLEYNPTLPEKA